MTDLIVVPQTNQWQKLKALVLDSVSSPITKRVYNHALDEFFEWFGQEPRPPDSRKRPSRTFIRY
jgi:predicted DCC family thiol-disulfide oxidoreductase YuxK